MISTLLVLAGMTVTCDDFVIKVPQKPHELPKLDFVYPTKVTVFSFRDGNLLLLAVDEKDSSRLRVAISAQASKGSHKYRGQLITDAGGNQLQIDNGAVECTAK